MSAADVTPSNPEFDWQVRAAGAGNRFAYLTVTIAGLGMAASILTARPRVAAAGRMARLTARR